MQSEFGSAEVVEPETVFGDLSRADKHCHRNVIALPDSEVVESFMGFAESEDADFLDAARSFINAKKTGTSKSAWMEEVTMLPTIGAAIGFITSEPMPLSHKMGMKLARTAVTVLNFGRNR